MRIRDDRPRIDAMLRHLGCGRDLGDFPGTASEKVALVRTAGARGLIAWRKARTRYELTSVGWDALTPRRRFGVSSLMLSAAMGGIAGSLTLAVFWLPDDASRRPVHRQSAVSMTRLEMSNAVQFAHAAEKGVPTAVPVPTVSVLQDDLQASVAEADRGELPRSEASQSVGQEPMAQAAVSVAKEGGVKKSRHKTARHRRDQGRNWAYANYWRNRHVRYAGYNEQRMWYGYR
jgi:hypothetical protein